MISSHESPRQCSKVGCTCPASDARMEEQFQHALFVDPTLTKDDVTAKGLKRAESLERFLKTHCHASHAFQIKNVVMHLVSTALNTLCVYLIVYSVHSCHLHFGEKHQ